MVHLLHFFNSMDYFILHIFFTNKLYHVFSFILLPLYPNQYINYWLLLKKIILFISVINKIIIKLHYQNIYTLFTV